MKVVGRVGSGGGGGGGGVRCASPSSQAGGLSSPRSCSPAVSRQGNMSAAPSPLHQPHGRVRKCCTYPRVVNGEYAKITAKFLSATFFQIHNITAEKKYLQYDLFDAFLNFYPNTHDSSFSSCVMLILVTGVVELRG